jgi:hypothetical protein
MAVNGGHYLHSMGIGTPSITASAGAQKNGPQSTGILRGCRNTKIHPVAANDRIVVAFHLSGGQCHDAPQGRLLPEDTRPDGLGETEDGIHGDGAKAMKMPGHARL